MSRPTRIALVVQRYGPEVNGGAEAAARAIAEQLATRLEVHVLTTCAVDYTTWANVYPAGTSQLNGVHLHRFPVDSTRDWNRAQKETGRFLQQERTLEDEIAWVRQAGPFATPLLQFIKRSAADFDAFIFFTYLYATTCFGLPLVAHKAILVPTAHDEPFLYMEIFRRLCRLPRHIIYLTHAEKELVQRITGNRAVPSDVLAMGIDPPAQPRPERFRHKYQVQGDFLLYGGRISEAKNVPELLDFFQRYLASHPRPGQLILMGQPTIPIPSHPQIQAIGFVSEQDKQDALSAATLVVLPSLFESLSIIILEAWLAGVPVLVNGRCEVTRQQCRLSNGGLYYTSYDEFVATLDRLLDTPPLRARLGQQGQQFVIQHYTWPIILDQYQQILHRVQSHQ